MARAVVDLIEAGLIESCHDVSDGGLAAAVAEMALLAAPDAAVGLRIDLAGIGGGVVAADVAARLLFCENGGFVIEVAEANAGRVRRVLDESGVWFRGLGRTTGERVLEIVGIDGARVALDLEEASRAWNHGAQRFMR